MPKCRLCGTKVPVIIYKTMTSVPICPNPACKCMYPEKPGDEAEMAILQDRWLQMKDKAALDRLSEMIADMVFHQIKAFSHDHHESYEQDEVDEIINSKFVYYKTKYLTDPNFKVGASFNSAIGMALLPDLYKNTFDERRPLSLDYSYGNDKDGGEKTLADFISNEDEMVSESFDNFKNVEIIEKAINKTIIESDMNCFQIFSFINNCRTMVENNSFKSMNNVFVQDVVINKALNAFVDNVKFFGKNYFKDFVKKREEEIVKKPKGDDDEFDKQPSEEDKLYALFELKATEVNK